MSALAGLAPKISSRTSSAQELRDNQIFNRNNTSKMAASQELEKYTIKPQASVPDLDSSDWPLLLKNYTSRAFCNCPIHFEADSVCSTCSNWPLHPHYCRMRAIEERCGDSSVFRVAVVLM